MHGKWLFYRSDASALYLISQVDSSAGLQNNFVADTIPVAPSSQCGATFASASADAPATGGYATVNITANGDCVYNVSSTVPWIVPSSYPLGSGNQTLSYLVRGNTGNSSRSGTLTVGAQSYTVTQDAVGEASTFNALSFNIGAADYSKSLDRMVLVSAAPNELHVYDPVTQADTTVALNAAPLSLSVSPDGRSALVGHNGSLSYIDLLHLRVSKTLPIDGVITNVALGNNGYGFAISASCGDAIWQSLGSVELASGNILAPQGGGFGSGNLVIDTALNYLYSGSLSVFDISKGPLQNVSTGSNAFGLAGGSICLSEDGTFGITNLGKVVFASDVPSQDLALDGTLRETGGLTWASDSSVQHTIAVIPVTWTGALNDTQVQFYAENGLQLQNRQPCHSSI